MVPPGSTANPSPSPEESWNGRTYMYRHEGLLRPLRGFGGLLEIVQASTFSQRHRFRLLHLGSLPQAERQQPLRVSISGSLHWADMNIIHPRLKLSRSTKKPE